MVPLLASASAVKVRVAPPKAGAEDGEVLAKGVPVFREYWKNPEATAKKYAGDWLLTGDLGRMDEDGYVFFKSRDDDVITSGGYRIGPGDIHNPGPGFMPLATAGLLGLMALGQLGWELVVVRRDAEPALFRLARPRSHSTQLPPSEARRPRGGAGHVRHRFFVADPGAGRIRARFDDLHQ